MKYLKLVLFLVTGFTFDCRAQAEWTLRNPLPTSDNLNHLYWTGEQLIALGSSGTILTSPDGFTWTHRNSGTEEPLHALTWTGTQYLVLGDRGLILTSPNGIIWTQRKSGMYSIGSTIMWTGKEYLFWKGQGDQNNYFYIYTSPDLNDWKQEYIYTSSTIDKPNTYIDSGFVKGLGTVYTTADGKKWRGPEEPKNALSKYVSDQKAWTGKLFVVVDSGRIRTSPDTLNWTTQDIGTTSKISAVAWTGTRVVAVGDGGTIITSPDGITWTGNDFAFGKRLSEVVWLNNQFIVVGDSGTIMISLDGINWTSRNSGTKVDLWKTIWLNNQFMVWGGDGTILTSPDGITWSIRKTGIPYYLSNLIWVGKNFVLYDNVPYGNDSIGYKSKMVLYTSPDAITWTNQNASAIDSMESLIWTGKLFAFLDDHGTVLKTSPDGITWTKINIGSTEVLRSLVWTGTQFVLSGDNGTILTSPDGITYTKRYHGTKKSLRLSLEDNGSDTKDIVASGDGVWILSSDGIYWTDITQPHYTTGYSEPIWTGKHLVRYVWPPKGGSPGYVVYPDTVGFPGTPTNLFAKTEVLWTGTYLVISERNDWNKEGGIFTSKDGNDWTKTSSIDGIGSFATNGTQIVAVGKGGVILTSPIVTPTRISPPQYASSPIKNTLSLRWSNSTLTATLPIAMHGRKVKAVLRNFTGRKVLERTVDKSQKEVQVPISGLPNGRYVLEIRSAEQMASKSVSLIH